MKRKLLAALLSATIVLGLAVGLVSCDDEPADDVGENQTTESTETEANNTESKDEESSDTESKDTESTDTESKDTESSESESKETEGEETESKETESEETESAEKLSAPTVSLSGDTASWDANLNADKFEISLDGNLSYVENTITSKTLANGQTIKVRAIGDGVNYLTSDWSNSVSYTATVTPNPENPNPENPNPENPNPENPNPENPNPQPIQLITPDVSIASSGLASWAAVENARGYAYKIDGGTEMLTSATSVQLTNGQSIVVKAIGDGTSYSDSAYSASKTYTAGAPTPAVEPTYLGILASKTEPSASAGLPEGLQSRSLPAAFGGLGGSSYRSFNEAIGEYFEDSNNYLGTSYPAASEYGIYSRAGETVYIQIWLNNPNQHTILSLMLNGQKYQVGGGLSSFFIQEGGEYRNCIYVAVAIPNDAHTEKSYTVSNIEYIADTYINADGTDTFMNENDTVKIGLPYNAENPTISDFNPTSLTMNSCSATLNVADASGLLNLTGGWLGIAVYDGYNIIANQSLAIGNNSVSATGLVENTDYWITVYLYADLRDGNGVTAHILFEQYILTPEAITFGEVNGTLLYNSEKDGYYGAINVNTTLNSNTAEYIKLEILKDDEVVYTDTSYNGTATISEGILCGNSYTVRVYYKDTEYPEGKYVEQNAWVDSLGTPWYYDAGVYTFVNDAVYYFNLGNGDNNYPAIDSFVLKLYKEESARWVANDVLYLLEHSTAIDDLNAQIDVLREQLNAAYGNSDLMNQIHDEIEALEEQLDPLEYALWYLESRADNNRDISYWQAEAAKGKYFYEFEYNGTNTDKLFKVGKYYYVVLDDALTYGINGLDIEIDYKYDAMDGNGLIDGKVNNQSINLDRELTNHWVEMENVSYSDGKLTLTLYNEEDWSTGVRPPYAIGYVYKVMVGEKILYLDDSTHSADIDEEAWFAEYIRRIKAGESVDDLMSEFVGDYEASYEIPLDLSEIQAGAHPFDVYIRLIATDYEDEDDYHARRTEVGVEVYKKIGKPSIQFGDRGETVSDELYGWEGEYIYEAEDKNGNPVTITFDGEEGTGRSFKLPAAGTKVRVKLGANGYWYESEFSDWYTFEGIKVSAPTLGEYSNDTCSIGWSLENGAYVSHYVYTLNGGDEVEIALNGTLSIALENGDVLRIKCVASAEGLENGYLDSEWVEFTCTDSRTRLNVPSNIRFEDGMLVWDEVVGAEKYIIEQTYTGNTQEIERNYIGWSAKIGATYRVRAIPTDAENYKLSAWSDTVLFSVTLENPTFDSIRRERVYWFDVEYSEGYNYKIGENGEVNTTSNYYVALSEIPVGEKLYVQAYAEGCTSSEWVMMYHNVTKLATPEVTVSGGTASWSAIENAEGYLYKINGGEELSTTELSVSGLEAGDTITVCASTDEFGYGNSDWSEIKTQLPTMSAPVLDTSLLSSEGTVSWGVVEGATAYEYDLEGSVNTFGETSVGDIQYGQSFKVRAVCDNGEYEQYGEWCEVVVREDTREQLATPVIAYDPEVGLTVVANDPKVSYYEVMFGQDGLRTNYYPPDGALETEVITDSLTFPSNDHTVYVKAVPMDTSTYRESEWATLTIEF